MNNTRPWVLVTGASGGIGKALVDKFTKNGFNVIATDIKQNHMIQLNNVVFVHLDICQFVESEDYKNKFIQKVDDITDGVGLSALINNAAVQILGSCENITLNEWNKSMLTNVTAPFFIIQNFLPSLSKNSGSVVNISSIHATQTKPSFITYATSKAALSALTRNLAVDLRDKIRINAIEPAAVSTEMLKAGFESNIEGLNELENYHPIGRIAKPEEIAELALYLCSDKSQFVHGACLSVTGGISNCLHDPN